MKKYQGVNWKTHSPKGTLFRTVEALNVCVVLSALLFAAALTLRPAIAGEDVWTSQGPYLGDFKIVVADPTDPSIIYAGGNSGVFKSTDGGATWSPGPNGNSDLPFFSTMTDLVIDPLNPANIYVSYDDGGGLHKSTDGGVTWSSIENGITVNVLNLAINPDTPSILYAAGTLFYRSTDGGASWEDITDSLGTTPGGGTIFINSIAVDPHTPTTIYAGTFAGAPTLHKSTDGGDTWVQIANFSGNILIDPVTPNIIYTYSFGGGVHKSINGGATWNAMNNGLDTLTMTGLAIDPNMPATLYASTFPEGFYKSTDGGMNWSPITYEFPFPRISALAVIPENPSTVYVNAGGGFKSTDGGATWSSFETRFLKLPIATLALAPSNPTTIYTGLPEFFSDAIFFKSIDGGMNWQAKRIEVDDENSDVSVSPVTAIAVHPLTPDIVYLGTRESGVFRSTDGGDTWFAYIRTNFDVEEIAAVVFDPVNPDNIYVGSRGRVFKSTDGGNTWSGSDLRTSGFVSLAELIVDPNNPATLYAGTFRDGVFKSTDGGISWNEFTNAISDSGIAALAIDPSNSTTLYASAISEPGDFGVFLQSSTLYKSTDSGASWSELNTGFGNFPVLALAVDPDNANIVYAGTFGGGVLKSTNGGASWAPFNPGLTALTVASLAIDPSMPAKVYAGTSFYFEDEDNFALPCGVADITQTEQSGDKPYMLLAAEDIEVSSLFYSDGDIHANDDITFNSGASNPFFDDSPHFGNLSAVDVIDIARDNTIDGDVNAGGDLDNNGTITGDANENADVDAVLLPVLASFSAGSEDIMVGRDEEVNLQPGSYGDVIVERGGKLNLSHGVYFMNELELGTDAELQVSTFMEGLTLNIVNDLEFGSRSRVFTVGGDRRNFTINSIQTKNIDIGREAQITAIIIAPEAKVRANSYVHFQGSICAEDIRFGSGALLLSHDGLSPLPKTASDLPEDGAVAQKFALDQNYPNPFNPTTQIAFQTAEAGFVELKVYDISGRLVKTLVNENREAGSHTVQWNATNDFGQRVTSGIYLYKLASGRNLEVKKMILLK